MNPILRAAALAGLSILLLSACQSAREKAMCPVANVLANTSSMTVFKPGMQGDPGAALFSIQITAVKASCGVDVDEGTTDSDLDITFRITRAPSGDAGNFTAPYYVASVVNGNTIINKTILGVAFSFAPGEATRTFTENVPSTVIHLENGKKPYEYGLLVGLQLTREQLDYLKNNGRFTP